MTGSPFLSPSLSVPVADSQPRPEPAALSLSSQPAAGLSLSTARRETQRNAPSLPATVDQQTMEEIIDKVASFFKTFFSITVKNLSLLKFSQNKTRSHLYSIYF